MLLKPKIKRFEAVKNALTGAILEGRFKPGDRLPSLRELCTYFKVSLATIQRAIRELKDEEWLASQPWKGVSVADPLPPVAHLLRVKSADRPTPARSGVWQGSITVSRSRTLRCLIYDESLLIPFERAAQEHAEAYAPYSMRFELQSFIGHDDEESVRSLDADLVLLPSHAVNRAVRLGVITPAAGMLRSANRHFTDLSPEILDLVTYQDMLWAVPIMASGAILVAHGEQCRRFGIDPGALDSVAALLAALEAAAESTVADNPPSRLFNITFILVLVLLAGHALPPIRKVPDLFADPDIHSLLERLRALARHRSVVSTRFDQWPQIDLSALAIRHQPSGLFCQDPANRNGMHILPVLQDGSMTAPLTAHCLCIGARSLHPYEAWEWAARLAETPFQRHLAELGYEIPVNLHPDVTAAFRRTVGDANARALLDMVRQPSRLYGVGPEDVSRYLWEVLSNELNRFVTGMNDYPQLRERVQTKTERYLAIYGDGEGSEQDGRTPCWQDLQNGTSPRRRTSSSLATATIGARASTIPSSHGRSCWPTARPGSPSSVAISSGSSVRRHSPCASICGPPGSVVRSTC